MAKLLECVCLFYVFSGAFGPTMRGQNQKRQKGQPHSKRACNQKTELTTYLPISVHLGAPASLPACSMDRLCCLLAESAPECI